MNVNLADLRHLLIDLDGVLFTGTTALPGASEFVHWLRSSGITFRLVTNNSTLTPPEYVEKLARMSIHVDPEEVFTSALATGQYLQGEGATGQTALVLGEGGLLDAVASAGLRLVDQGADWVIAGLDRTLTYEKLATAALSIHAGARFVVSNPDTSLPSERGLLPGAGATLAALAATTGKVPVVIGKPQPLMFTLAMDSLGGTLADTAMLGDRLDTDIAGAEGMGMPAIMVLTGVSTRREEQDGPVHASLVVDSLPALVQTWKAAARA